MAKINFTFTDEIGSNLNRYKAIDVNNNGVEYTFDLSRMANITQVGTPLSAEYLNAIVNSINALYDSNYLQDTINRNIKFVDENGNQTAIIETGGGASFASLNLTDLEQIEQIGYFLVFDGEDTVVYKTSAPELVNQYSNHILNNVNVSNYAEGNMSIENAFYDVDTRIGNLNTSLNNYVPKTGGNMEGALNFPNLVGIGIPSGSGPTAGYTTIYKGTTSTNYAPTMTIYPSTNANEAITLTFPLKSGKLATLDDITKNTQNVKYIHNLYVQLYFVDENSSTNAGVKDGYFNLQIINSSENEITDLLEIYNYIDKSTKNWIYGSYNFGNSNHMEKILTALDKQQNYALQFGQNGLIASLGLSSTKFTIDDSVIEM